MRVKENKNAPSFSNDGVAVGSRLRKKKKVSYFEEAPERKMKRRAQNDSDDSDWSGGKKDVKPKKSRPSRPKKSKPSRPKKSQPVKTEVFADGESSSNEDSYTQMREKNIASRMEFLKRMGVSLATKKEPQKRVFKNRVSDADSVVRTSDRLKNKVTGDTISLELEPLRDDRDETPTFGPRKPSGPLPMVSMRYDSEEKDDGEAATKCADFINLLRPFLVKKEGDESKLNSCSLESFTKTMQGLSLSEDMAVKVCHSRIASMTFHPSEEKPIVVAGCRQGTIGLWDVNNSDPEKCVEVMEPHSAQVNCITFSTANPSKLYTASYDGTVRRGDLMGLVFDEIYASDPNLKMPYVSWLEQYEAHTLLLAEGSGTVTIVDTRSPMQAERVFQCHERLCRTVQVYPKDSNYFVTASGLGEVCIWDQRVNKEAPTPLHRLEHPRRVTSAFFSPEGNSLITTCCDDRVRLYHTEDLSSFDTPKVVTNIKHNNYTGRWLSVFKAIWHPLREDVFLIGSLDKPRRINLYGIDGDIVHNFESDNLNTVCSVNAWHPTMPMLAGGNSAGRVHVFK